MPTREGNRGQPGSDRQRVTPTASAVLEDGAVAELVYEPRARRTSLAVWREQGWELVAIEPADRPRGVITATYVFKRPATGKPKGEDKPDAKPAPKATDGPKTELRLYQLKNANAADMVALIDEVLSINRGAMRVTADRRTNQVIVNAPSETQFDIEALLQRLDVAGAEKERPGEAGPAGGIGSPPGFSKKKK